MKNVLYKKIWRTGAVQIHVEPLPNTLIGSNNYKKAEAFCVKIRLRGDPTSENRIYTSLKWPCLATSSYSSSYC